MTVRAQVDPELLTEPLLLSSLGYGARVLDYRIEQEIHAATGEARLFLADDERRTEYVLLVLSTSVEAFEEALGGAAAGTLLRRSKLGSWFIAAVELNDDHLGRFGNDLFAVAKEARAVTTGATQHSAQPPSDRLAVGDVFARRYRIEGVLGRGGMGEVYRANDPILKRTVALKLVRVDIVNDAEHRASAKDRLLSEARVVCGLRHPNIVELFDASEVDGIPYLVLELCEGGNLREVVAKNEASPADRLRWLTEMAKGLAFAHANGIVHRDIKPENILLTADGTAKISDFGIAKALGTQAADTFSIIGTPRYMAPEQLMGQRVDGRVDQFAWALVAEELFTGVHPREPLTHTEVRASSGRLPPTVAEVVRRAMASDVGSRYASFDALLAAMGGRKRRTMPALLATCLTTLAVVATVTTAVRQRTEAARPADTQDAAVFDIARVDADIVARCAAPARASLRAGLQLWRDASQWESLPRFEEAVDADPECAVASVYYLFAASHTFPRRREHYRRAREHRGTLNAREASLLEAMAPVIADPPDLEEALRRIARLSVDLPLDQDVQRLHARIFFRLGRFDEALAVVRAHDSVGQPPITGNEFVAAMIEVARRHPDVATKHFQRCLEVAPDSSDCLQWSGLLFASEGNCADAEMNFRKVVTVLPHSSQGNYNLAQVLLARTREPEVARSVFRQRWMNSSALTLSPEPSPEASEFADELRMAVLSGDLEGGVSNARRWVDAVASSSNGRYRGEPLLQLIELLRELGYSAEARTLALSGLREQRGWSGDQMLETQIEFARAAYVTGGLNDAQFRELRDDWIARRKGSPQDVWLKAFAGLPRLGLESPPPAEAADYVQDWLAMTPEGFARAADELSGLGRHDDAIRHAEAANASCMAFSAMGKFHAELSVARAYDRAGRKLNACEAYGSFVARFGKQPKSRSVRLARERIRLLSCL